jgi:hypothetical protein
MLHEEVEEEGDVRGPQAQQKNLHRPVDRSCFFPHGGDGFVHLAFHVMTGSPVLLIRNRTHFSNPTIQKAASPTPTTRIHSSAPKGDV